MDRIARSTQRIGESSDAVWELRARRSPWMRGIVAFLVGRPLVAIAIALAAVGVLLLSTHRQRTPVTHRVQHVQLTDAQQMQLGSRQYAKTLRQNGSAIVS